MPRLAVLGHPVAHSRSPAMQNAALAALGLGEEWSYEAMDVAPDEFAERVRALAADGYAGANVTVPHKQAALAAADTPSAVAREIGAANTLVFSGGGVQAHNTDAEGFLTALPGSPRDRRALVLGAGGAARAVVWALAREGAAVAVWNRTPERAAALCAELGGTPVADPAQDEYELIVNTSAAGLGGEDPFAPAAGPGPLLLAADRRRHGLRGAAARCCWPRPKTAGAAAVDGLEILVQQGALSLEIWTGREPPLDAMRAAARA